MQTPKDDVERLQLLIALGNQPGVSAWFSVWQLARIGRPASEVWGGASSKTTSPRERLSREDCTA